MRYKYHRAKLGNREVVDVQLIANGYSGGVRSPEDPACVFTCESDMDAVEFIKGIRELMEKYTAEILEV